MHFECKMQQNQTTLFWLASEDSKVCFVKSQFLLHLN